MEKEISKYQIVWVEFRATKGIVTKHDETLLIGREARGNNGKSIFKHFKDKNSALECLEFQKNHGWFNKLNKPYEVRICTDAQFGRANIVYKTGHSEMHVKYTELQENEMFVIGNE